MSYAPQSALDYLTQWVNDQLKAINNDIDNVIMPQLLGQQQSINALNSGLADAKNRINEATSKNFEQDKGLALAYSDMQKLYAMSEQNAANIAALAAATNTAIDQRPINNNSGLGGILGSLGLGLGIGTGTLLIGAGVVALLLLRK